jgi:hypothetical protein
MLRLGSVPLIITHYNCKQQYYVIRNNITENPP